MTPEHARQNKFRMWASQNGYTLFRNNTGKAYQGQTIWANDRASVTIKNPRLVSFGLCEGSSDLIGWRTINGVAQFCAFEIKADGATPTPEQVRFMNAVVMAGGHAKLIDSDLFS